ncbi:MAG: type IVB secretion system protein IcmH/DotU [Gammaproteobacteria bacterium]|nr:type IVB secretion system protein IcmH/DotU [Gammaproteobacteria bacterium]MCH9744784.1 type IVB secretion system protein IcmH/DotU [Gammaproteobacteria bacterium]
MDILNTEVTHFTDQRAPISGQFDGQESNAFEINIAINPLIAAATPLFTLAKQLRKQNTCPDLAELKQSLEHEIHAFENKAHQNGYRSQVILGARYQLCSFIDEIIAFTHWGKHHQWSQEGLLKTFQNEQWGGERFFIILDRCAEDAAIYIDLLELGYLFLSLGYRGRYSHPDKQYELGSFIDRLYDIIQQQRGELAQQILIKDHNINNSNKSQWKWPPIWSTVVSGALLLSLIYMPYYNRLTKLTDPINRTMINIGQSNL